MLAVSIFWNAGALASSRSALVIKRLPFFDGFFSTDPVIFRVGSVSRRRVVDEHAATRTFLNFT